MKTSENLTKIAPALLAAQAEIKSALKDSTNPHFKNRYADLESVIAAVKPSLNKHGIVYLQPASESEDGRLHLTTRLLHESGEWMESTAVCPLPKADPQGFGSAMTYLRRYSLASFIGVAQSDDDGEGAAHREEAAPKPKPAPSPPAGKPADTITPAMATEDQKLEIAHFQLNDVTKETATKGLAYYAEKEGVDPKSLKGLTAKAAATIIKKCQTALDTLKP